MDSKLNRNKKSWTASCVWDPLCPLTKSVIKLIRIEIASIQIYLHILILEYTLIHASFELDASNCNSSFQTTLDTLYPTSPSDKLYGSDECEIFALTKSFFTSLLVDLSFNFISWISAVPLT